MSTLEETLLVDVYHKTSVGSSVDADGDIESVKGLENIREALLRRLVTTPGSLVHRPEYGVGVEDYQNSPMSLANQRSLALRIKEQFELDSRVDEVTRFRLQVNDKESSKLIIFTTVKIKGYGEVSLEFTPFEGDFNG